MLPLGRTLHRSLTMEPVWPGCRAGADGPWVGAFEQSSASSQTVPRSPRCTPRKAAMPGL